MGAELDVGGEMVAAVFKGAGGGGWIAELGLGDGFDGETGFAQAAEEIAPAVKKFHGALFTVRPGPFGG